MYYVFYNVLCKCDYKFKIAILISIIFLIYNLTNSISLLIDPLLILFMAIILTILAFITAILMLFSIKSEEILDKHMIFNSDE